MNENRNLETIYDDAAMQVENERLQSAIAARRATVGQIDPELLVKFRKTRPYEREGVKVRRNDPCPCGSGKKFKHCCIDSGNYNKVTEI